MICALCAAPSKIRFCSNECLVAFSRAQRGVECAICEWDPVRGRPGNIASPRICSACSESPENSDWHDPSDLEQVSDDVDVTMAIAGASRLGEIYGGRRKLDSVLAARIVNADRQLVRKRKRRRNENGSPLRGFVEVDEPKSHRDIAKEVGCSEAYVRKVLARVYR